MQSGTLFAFGCHDMQSGTLYASGRLGAMHLVMYISAHLQFYRELNTLMCSE